MKKIGRDDEIKTYSLSFNPAIAAQKMPVDVTGGLTPLSDFMEIPCDKIVEYQSKSDADFRSWPADKFEVLVDSIASVGVLQPVVVRPLKNEEGKYEMLAGEHRWKASIEAKKGTVPAKVMRDCDDEMAATIFAVTNVLSRENTIRDKVNGWWSYTKSIYYKREDKIKQMVSEGILSSDIISEAEGHKRQIYRYARMHELIDELLDLADQKHLSITVGERLSYLSTERQSDLLPYKQALNNPTKASLLLQLDRGDLEGKKWSKEEIEAILYPKEPPKTYTLNSISTRIKTAIRDKVSRKAYTEIETIIYNAIDEYLNQNPEHKAKSDTTDS